MVFWLFYLIVPGLACLCAGSCLTLFFQAIRNRLFGRAVLLALPAVLFVLVCLWAKYSDIRLVDQRILYVLMLCVGFAATWRLWRSWASWPTAYTTAVLLVGSACAGLLLLGGVFSMRSSEDQKAVSPDGRYRADLIYYDGLTFGYYFVAVKPTSWPHFLEPAHEVAEADSEGFDGIHWDGARTLVLQHEKDAPFAQKDSRWHDIRIVYQAVSSHP